jgi:hypothetical protein
MPDERWERLGAATGILFVVVAAIGLVFVPTPPGPTAPDAEVVAYSVEHRDGLLIQSYLFGLAGVFFLWFLGSLRAYLGKAEGEGARLSAIAFGGGIATFAAFGTGSGIAAALAYSIAGQADPGITVALSRVAAIVFTGTAFPLVVLVAATALVGGRTKTLPAWHGWFGWLLIPIALISSLAVFFGEGSFAPGGLWGYILFGVFLMWFLATSLLLTQRVGRDSRPTKKD